MEGFGVVVDKDKFLGKFIDNDVIWKCDSVKID